MDEESSSGLKGKRGRGGGGGGGEGRGGWHEEERGGEQDGRKGEGAV